ncbi:MAG: kinase-like domain-containing protein [Benjaminiella poitrasii]|nr:MAG: kinase-like domain-containing protein [Benjaminiella poitrasii]
MELYSASKVICNVGHLSVFANIYSSLVNHIRPGTIKLVGQKKELSFVQIDNISRFLQGAKQLGIPDNQLFQPDDLYSGKDMSLVIHTILTLVEKNTSLNKEESDQDKQNSPFNTNNSSTKQSQYRHIRDIFTEDPSQTPQSSNKKSLQVNVYMAQQHASTRPLKSPLRQRTPNTSIHIQNRPSTITLSDESIYSSPTSSTCSSPTIPKTPVSPPILLPDKKIPHYENRTSTGTMETFKSLQDTIEDSKGCKVSLKDDQGKYITTYQLGNCIGKGQFGSVYRTLDLSNGEVVAIKRVKLEDESLYKEIMKEVNILKALSHSNVVKYIGFIPTQDYLNIVLEYAENGSLLATLKAFGAFPEKLVASFCIKILKGLEYLHENQVVHCDLKAANILTTKTGDVKLTDFGVSLNLKAVVDVDTISGTPNWMAPEVIELKGATTKSDIWSLGCTLVELVTGKPPYSDILAMSAMFRIVEDEYPPLPENISKEMKSFLLCCFRKDPNKRSSSKELQKHEWIIKNQQKKKSTKKSLSRANSTIKKSSFHSERQYYSLNANSSSFMDNSSSHQFVETSFGKEVECKVCTEIMTHNSLFCEVCSLLCHKECKKLAFSCPPKVNEQQPSYDWVFSAKIYNNLSHGGERHSRKHIPQEFKTITANTTLNNHPHAENIKKFSRALGLTMQEQLALSQNTALLEHTLNMEKMINTPRQQQVTEKKKGQEEQCYIM